MEGITIAHIKAYGHNMESWIAITNDNVIGHIYMLREDDHRIKFLDGWVEPKHRSKGIFKALLNARWDYVTSEYMGYSIYS